ncbi:MAG TPA: hypothetical protein VHB98_23465, partial [Chloroflexota bacterium]|nr:hypothetical protein [Chloroflexota bacterium]
MNITESTAGDVTLQQAATDAGCNAKTIRRAVQDGQLPRRYVMSERGPQLVFTHGDVEQWIAGRASRKRSSRHSRPSQQETANDWIALAHRVEQLQAVLAESHVT